MKPDRLLRDPEVKVNKRVLQALNAKGAFRGQVKNAENVGKTADDLVTQWNQDHPDDPVEE